MVTPPLVFRFTDDQVITARRSCGLVVVPDLLQQVRRWCASGGSSLIVDLSPARELDLTVFRVLFWGRRHLALRGEQLVIVEPRAGVLPAGVEHAIRGVLALQPNLESARRAAGAAPDPHLRQLAAGAGAAAGADMHSGPVHPCRGLVQPSHRPAPPRVSAAARVGSWSPTISSGRPSTGT